MSGLIRTIQKRIFKTKFGLGRQTSEVRTSKLDGSTYMHRFPKGKGPIVNNLGEPLGRHYPFLLSPTE